MKGGTSMVKVFYGSKQNAILGGVMFRDGIAEFEDNEKGIRFAEMFHRKYEVVAEAKKPVKKKVKKVE